MIRELIQAGAEDETIKNIICLEFTEAEVQEKKMAWMEMWGKENKSKNYKLLDI